jgi:hypothetical protein
MGDLTRRPKRLSLLLKSGVGPLVILLLTFFLPLPGAAWAGTGPAANHRPVASISAPGEVVRENGWSWTVREAGTRRATR